MLQSHLKVSVQRCFYQHFNSVHMFLSIPILVHIHTLRAHVHAVLAARATQHVDTPTISQLFNYYVENLCDQKSNHEIHKILCHEIWSCTVHWTQVFEVIPDVSRMLFSKLLQKNRW